MSILMPQHIPAYLDQLDEFIEQKLQPIEQADDNIRFFDHRREYSRTDWENDGLPTAEWEALLGRARELAHDAGHLAFALPAEYGGGDATNLEMAIVREHLTAKGIGLHCDLQNEHAIVGNFPTTLAFRDFGTQAQKDEFIPGSIDGSIGVAFGLTEPEHGSDATWMETRAVPRQRDGVDGWLLNGTKMWTTGAHIASHILIFARVEGRDGSAYGIRNTGPHAAGRPCVETRSRAIARQYGSANPHDRLTVDRDVRVARQRVTNFLHQAIRMNRNGVVFK